MTNWQTLFSSASGDWATPEDLYEELNWEFDFDFDPCPLNPDFDGLNIEWGTSNYVNPPYGRDVWKWLKKGVEEHRQGKTVVFLLPARTDTKWFHEYILPYAHEIRFLRGRLKFSGHQNSAPFPSMIIVYHGYVQRIQRR